MKIKRLGASNVPMDDPEVGPDVCGQLQYNHTLTAVLIYNKDYIVPVLITPINFCKSD